MSSNPAWLKIALIFINVTIEIVCWSWHLEIRTDRELGQEVSVCVKDDLQPTFPSGLRLRLVLVPRRIDSLVKCPQFLVRLKCLKDSRIFWVNENSIGVLLVESTTHSLVCSVLQGLIINYVRSEIDPLTPNPPAFYVTYYHLFKLLRFYVNMNFIFDPSNQDSFISTLVG